MSEHDWRMIRASLAYDKRNSKGSSRGRALQANYPMLGLLKGDRLEPCAQVPDIGAGFDAENPGRALFWRVSQESICVHRNPIFNSFVGIVPEDALVVDWLHCLSLGVFKHFLAHLIHRFIHANVWGVDPGASIAVRIHVSCQRLRSELFAWYSAEERENREPTRVQDLVPGMLGSSENPALNLHGGEVNGVLMFAGVLISRCGTALGDSLAATVRAHSALVTVKDIITNHPVMVPPTDAQRLMDATKIALRMMQELGVPPKPKMHAMVHLAHDAREKGSPALHGTWLDEGLNRVLKQMASGAHRIHWTRRVLDNMNDVLARRVRHRVV